MGVCKVGFNCNNIFRCVEILFYSEQPGSTEPDVHHIDFRVGKILSAKRHSDADTLFVEESKQQFIVVN